MSNHVADIDDLIEESHRLREELIRVAAKLDSFSVALAEENIRNSDSGDTGE